MLNFIKCFLYQLMYKIIQFFFFILLICWIIMTGFQIYGLNKPYLFMVYNFFKSNCLTIFVNILLRIWGIYTDKGMFPFVFYFHTVLFRFCYQGNRAIKIMYFNIGRGVIILSFLRNCSEVKLCV